MARSLVAFRDLALSILHEVVGIKSKPTQRERFLKVALSWYTQLLVSLHAVGTASVGLEYILGQREQRIELVSKDATWNLTRKDAEQSIDLLARLWDQDTPYASWLNSTAEDGLREGQLEASTACWEAAFARGFRTQPLEAAWASQAMGIVMHGLWKNTQDEFYRGRTAEWWTAAVKLSNGRDEGMCMLAAWCLNRLDATACNQLVPDYAKRLADLSEKPPLLAQLIAHDA